MLGDLLGGKKTMTTGDGDDCWPDKNKKQCVVGWVTDDYTTNTRCYLATSLPRHQTNNQTTVGYGCGRNVFSVWRPSLGCEVWVWVPGCVVCCGRWFWLVLPGSVVLNLVSGWFLVLASCFSRVFCLPFLLYVWCSFPCFKEKIWLCVLSGFSLFVCFKIVTCVCAFLAVFCGVDDCLFGFLLVWLWKRLCSFDLGFCLTVALKICFLSAFCLKEN